MLVQEYPVTTPYGYVAGYPLHNGFHQGIDYGCPVGTPVLVNGVTIGISGNTGYTTGPHCHVGKWLGGTVQNPLNGGFQFNSAVVTEINEDSDNGKYVRIQGDGFSWVYCHLSDNSIVNVGRVLIQEDEMVPWNNGDSLNFSKLVLGESNPPTFVTDQEGKDFKDALYAIIAESNMEQFVKANAGDNVNIQHALGNPDSSNLTGQPFKSIIYNYILKNLPAGVTPITLKPGDYRVKE